MNAEPLANQETPNEASAAATDRTEIAAVLAQYRHRQVLESITGPAFSLAFHVLVLGAMFAFVMHEAAEAQPSVEVVLVSPVDVVEFEDPVPPDEVPPEPPTLAELLPEKDKDVAGPARANDNEPGDTRNLADLNPADPAEAFNPTDFDSKPIDVEMRLTARTLPFALAGRADKKTRGQMVGDGGGSTSAQQRIPPALTWLARVQNDDGSWGNQSPAHTGLALLAFLGYGETPLSEKYGTTVQKAIKWLVDKEMSSADGNLGQNGYGHGIAAYALAESYGMTRIPLVRPAMERALDVIVKGQQAGGGYNYNYDRGPRWDTSVSGWQLQALKAGVVAGATTPGLDDAIRTAVNFLRRTAYANYKFGYANTPGSGGNMTGIGVVNLQLLGAAGCPEAQGGVVTVATERLGLYRQVLAAPGRWDEVMGPNLYGFYYDTQALFNAEYGRAAATSGGAWKEWRNVFEKVLIRGQHPDGYWEVKSGWGLGADLPGRVMATCQCLLQIEVYYRYLPTFDLKRMEAHGGAAASNIDAAGGPQDSPLKI